MNLSFQEPLSLGWANLQLFDFNDRLMNEKVSLNLWPLPQGMDDLLNYVGLPGKKKIKNCNEPTFAFCISYSIKNVWLSLLTFLKENKIDWYLVC